MKKLAAWFDIPVSDMARAITFYEHVTSQKLKRMPVGENKETALFEADGCLFLAPEDKPSHFGSRVYFNADSGVDDWLVRVEAAGGKTLVAKTPIGSGQGFFAYFEDTEGNRVGLHEQS
jgi:predicted enzyme related to lactoylglutathione lyase